MTAESVFRCKTCGAEVINIYARDMKSTVMCDAVPIRFKEDASQGSRAFLTADGAFVRGRRTEPREGLPKAYMPHWRTCEGAGAESENLTPEQIKKLMKARAPVMCRTRISADYENIEYAYISAMIIRYNPERQKFELTLELTDKTERALYIAPLKDVRAARNN